MLVLNLKSMKSQERLCATWPCGAGIYMCVLELYIYSAYSAAFNRLFFFLPSLAGQGTSLLSYFCTPTKGKCVTEIIHVLYQDLLLAVVFLLIWTTHILSKPWGFMMTVGFVFWLGSRRLLVSSVSSHYHPSMERSWTLGRTWPGKT